MFSFMKKLCGCSEKDKLAKRQADAHEQDKTVRESMSEKQIDKGLKDTMEASDPVANTNSFPRGITAKTGFLFRTKRAGFSLTSAQKWL